MEGKMETKNTMLEAQADSFTILNGYISADSFFNHPLQHQDEVRAQLQHLKKRQHG